MPIQKTPNIHFSLEERNVIIIGLRQNITGHGPRKDPDSIFSSFSFQSLVKFSYCNNEMLTGQTFLSIFLGQVSSVQTMCDPLPRQSQNLTFSRSGTTPVSTGGLGPGERPCRASRSSPWTRSRPSVATPR